MSKANLIWWAVVGTLFSLLIAVACSLLAVGNGDTVTEAVIFGVKAAGACAGLWIAATAAIHGLLKR
ncbi:hypothetical protein ACIBIZ_01715 [Nonomuraea spiralis]|uniref:hypothetical protein n=1 Tax=Nonomuraea TaxID=83681 RepID=UPI000F7A0CB7|nr:hypothetical protein [Nonomuraea sp. WAC 01424]RSN14622.1 hypothetical protein DMB42_09070 [Nonomuraea sp. WAC 01424]